MRIDDFDYSLPDELIASVPLPERTASRMLHIDRNSGVTKDHQFSELTSIVRPGDLLVFNNTRVFPARLNGTTDTGASIELLLEEETADGVWAALAKPAKRLKPGRRIEFSDELSALVEERRNGGEVVIRFSPNADLWAAFDSVGRVPLPHYIKRPDSDADRERYQTVFAKERGAIAAPTAGLHFNDEIVGELKASGVQIAEITLHVGYGTFEPVRAEDLKEHRVLPERFEISEETANILNAVRSNGRRIVAVGTTTTRALESAIDAQGKFQPQRTRTSLTVVPGDKFRAVDAMLTNFHLPKSSLLILVSTFGGHDIIMKAYEHAVSERYRFYSYGDCMFIE
jgi:S-adenosylmethionine:tRNA ribosyltransferase-isomerase